MRKVIAALFTCIFVPTACVGPNYFPQFSVLRLQSGDVDRDLALFDEAAAHAGFAVTPNHVPSVYDGVHKVGIRVHSNPNECCFRMSLSKWDQQLVIELILSDSGTYDIGLRTSYCEMYARFREALRPVLENKRILFEKRPCAQSGGVHTPIGGHAAAAADLALSSFA